METDLSKVQSVLERIESTMDKDRESYDRGQIKLDKIISLLEYISNRQPRLEDKVSDAVQDGLKPLVDTVQQVRKTKNKSLLKVLQLWSKGVKKNG